MALSRRSLIRMRFRVDLGKYQQFATVVGDLHLRMGPLG
jgi:hypothetical protein